MVAWRSVSLCAALGLAAGASGCDASDVRLGGASLDDASVPVDGSHDATNDSWHEAAGPDGGTPCSALVPCAAPPTCEPCGDGGCTEYACVKDTCVPQCLTPGCLHNSECPGIGACPRCADSTCAENRCVARACQITCEPGTP